MIRTYRVTALVAVASSSNADPLREADEIRALLESRSGVRVAVELVEPVPDEPELPSDGLCRDSDRPTKIDPADA